MTRFKCLQTTLIIMRTLFCATVLSLILPITVKCQTGRVVYDAIINHSQKGTPKDEMFKDDLYAKAWLYFDGRVSLYRQLLPDSTINIRSGGGDVGYMRTKYPVNVNDTTGSIYRMDYVNKSIKSRMPIYNMKSFYVVDDKIETIQWSIKSEKKNIGKFKVIRAEADYLGRKWIAWFAPDIPVSMGPWKLYGLPGLILAAEDTSRKFKFSLRDLNIPFLNASKLLNAKVLDQKGMRKSEFILLEKKKKDDQYRFTKANMEAAAGTDGGPVTVKINFAETIEIYK